jgi:hypothetical protein
LLELLALEATVQIIRKRGTSLEADPLARISRWVAICFLTFSANAVLDASAQVGGLKSKNREGILLTSTLFELLKQLRGLTILEHAMDPKRGIPRSFPRMNHPSSTTDTKFPTIGFRGRKHDFQKNLRTDRRAPVAQDQSALRRNVAGDTPGCVLDSIVPLEDRRKAQLKPDRCPAMEWAVENLGFTHKSRSSETPISGISVRRIQTRNKMPIV